MKPSIIRYDIYTRNIYDLIVTFSQTYHSFRYAVFYFRIIICGEQVDILFYIIQASYTYTKHFRFLVINKINMMISELKSPPIEPFQGRPNPPL